MKILKYLSFFLLLFPLAAYPEVNPLTPLILDDYRKHDPAIILLCEKNTLEISLHVGDIKGLEYRLQKYTPNNEISLIYYETDLGGEKLRITKGRYSIIDDQLFEIALARYSEQFLRIYRGQGNDCIQSKRV